MKRTVALLALAMAHVAALLVATSVAAAGKSATGDVEATFSMESQSLTLDEPVRVTLSVVNGSSTPVVLNLGRDYQEHFSLALTRPDGSYDKLPPIPVREGLHVIGRTTLGPGTRMGRVFLLNEWTTFETTGSYLLEITLTSQIQTIDGPLSGPTARLPFQITDRDEVRLHQVCDRLTRQIERSYAVLDAHEAVRALAHISEPLAVPYLERALASGRYIESFAIDALARIGNADAVRVLIAVVNESPQWPPDPNTTVGTRSLRAYRALKEIGATTTDAALRTEIALALRRR